MTGKSAGRYITKYLTKEWPPNGSAKMREYTKTRICQASADIAPIMRPKTDWTTVKYNMAPFDAWSFAKNIYSAAHKAFPYKTKLEYSHNMLMLTTQITENPMDKDLIEYPLFRNSIYSTVEVFEHLVQRDFLEVNDHLTPFPDELDEEQFGKLSPATQ